MPKGEDSMMNGKPLLLTSDEILAGTMLWSFNTLRGFIFPGD